MESSDPMIPASNEKHGLQVVISHTRIFNDSFTQKQIDHQFEESTEKILLWRT